MLFNGEVLEVCIKLKGSQAGPKRAIFEEFRTRVVIFDYEEYTKLENNRRINCCKKAVHNYD